MHTYLVSCENYQTTKGVDECVGDDNDGDDMYTYAVWCYCFFLLSFCVCVCVGFSGETMKPTIMVFEMEWQVSRRRPINICEKQRMYIEYELFSFQSSPFAF